MTPAHAWICGCAFVHRRSTEPIRVWLCMSPGRPECLEHTLGWEACEFLFRVGGDDPLWCRSVLSGSRPQIWTTLVNAARVSKAQSNPTLAINILRVATSKAAGWDVAGKIAEVAMLDAAVAAPIITAGRSYSWTTASDLADLAITDLARAEVLIGVGVKEGWDVAGNLVAIATVNPAVVGPLLDVGNKHHGRHGNGDAEGGSHLVRVLANVAAKLPALVPTVLQLGQDIDWEFASTMSRIAMNDPAMTQLNLLHRKLTATNVAAIVGLLGISTTLTSLVLFGTRLNAGACRDPAFVGRVAVMTWQRLFRQDSISWSCCCVCVCCVRACRFLHLCSGGASLTVVSLHRCRQRPVQGPVGDATGHETHRAVAAGLWTHLRIGQTARASFAIRTAVLHQVRMLNRVFSGVLAWCLCAFLGASIVYVVRVVLHNRVHALCVHVQHAVAILVCNVVVRGCVETRGCVGAWEQFAGARPVGGWRCGGCAGAGCIRNGDRAAAGHMWLGTCGW